MEKSVKNLDADKVDDASNRRVLVVDDDRDFSSGLADLLTLEGYTVKLADSTDGARETLTRFHAGVALIDLRLGKGSGIDLLASLHSQHPELLCVMMTAYADLDTAVKALREGAYDYLRKPFHSEDLLATLNRCFKYINIIQEKTLAEEALRHSQKLESIGRLAGGIAHDFNNMLTAILGYSELSMMVLPEDHYVRENINTIYDTGKKAEALVRQLLAFSRKQVLEIKVINLNTIVENLGKMLSRMISEDILLKLNTQSPVSNVMADPIQVEQILMNLAVNARDAMPSGGSLIIETTDVVLDEEYTHLHEGLKAGPYVMLSVTDTGTGITKEVLQKLFEPFFTTKEVGKGTGLGLATVYGIVKQHKGHISVYSEEGKGTTFKVYLPATGKSEEAIVSEDKMLMSQGTETVLVVDDEPSIRKLISDSLRPLGYKIIEAACGEEALQISEKEETIDLLLSDVIMPGISGKDLANKFKSIRPETKIVFMSGYSGEEISSQKITEEDVVFIQKPLIPTSLAKKLRDILGA